MCEHRCLKSQNRFLRDALACAQWVLVEQARMRQGVDRDRAEASQLRTRRTKPSLRRVSLMSDTCVSPIVFFDVSPLSYDRHICVSYRYCDVSPVAKDTSHVIHIKTYVSHVW